LKKPNREKKQIKILKKPTDSVRFWFYKPETKKIEPNPNKKKTRKNRVKPEKNRAKPVGLNRFRFGFFFKKNIFWFGCFFFIKTDRTKNNHPYRIEI